MAIACDVTFATDYPGVNKNKHGDVKLEKVPVLAKGEPINININKLLEATARKLKMDVQYELTQRMTGTHAVIKSLTDRGIHVSIIFLLYRYLTYHMVLAHE